MARWRVGSRAGRRASSRSSDTPRPPLPPSQPAEGGFSIGATPGGDVELDAPWYTIAFCCRLSAILNTHTLGAG